MFFITGCISAINGLMLEIPGIYESLTKKKIFTGESVEKYMPMIGHMIDNFNRIPVMEKLSLGAALVCSSVLLLFSNQEKETPENTKKLQV